MMQSLLANQQTQSLIDRVTSRLASGRAVTTVLDNPQNYFAAQGLNNTASDLTRRLDNIGQSIQTINTALHSADAIEKLLELGQNVALQELDKVENAGGEIEIAEVPTVDPLTTQITNDSPAAYWRLNETTGGTAATSGTIGGAVNGTYRNGPTLDAAPLYEGGSSSVDFNGSNQYVSIPNNGQINTSVHTQRSVELVFNADTTTGRQVLYEEGATVNALSIYIDNGRLYVTGRDQGGWGPANISAPIVPGQTYHVAFTMNSNDGEFIGYVNGEEMGRAVVSDPFPAHSGDVAIGAMRNGNWFHNGSVNGDNYYFDGRIGDVALYNATLTPQDIADRAAAVAGITEVNTENVTFTSVMNQITALVHDSHYKGVNLLAGDSLNTIFDEDGTHNLLTEGVEFSTESLGIRRDGFDKAVDIREVLNDVQASLERVREYKRTLSLDLGVLQTREEFTRSKINNHIAGADKLTLADMNAEGARLLALQTRLSLGQTSLSLASQSTQSVLDLF